MPQPNTYAKKIGQLYLAIHTKVPPTDQEWEDSIRQMPPNAENIRTLVFTDGGAPNKAQRKRLSEQTGGKDFRTAVLSYSLIPRFVNASISLFIKSMRSFNPEEFPLAIEYLQITEDEKKLLLPEILAIQKKLGEENVKTVTRALKSAQWI